MRRRDYVQKHFDQAFHDALLDMTVAELLAVPGVMDVLIEDADLINETIAALEDEWGEERERSESYSLR